MLRTIHTDKIKILVIDDHDAFRELVVKVLTKNGFSAVTAEDAESALQILEHDRFDAIVSDISLPGMSGLDLLKAIRANDAEIPVILITGHSSLDTAVKAVKQGAQDYMIKPLDCAALIASINSLVKHYHRTLHNREMETLLTEAVEQERQTLGRELHDLLCQDLASIAMLSSLLEDNSDAIMINNLAKKSVSFVKGLCSGLFPVELEAEGLVSAVSQLVTNCQNMTDISCITKVSGNIHFKDKAKALHIYRIIQESIKNSIKHSNASNLDIEIDGENESGSMCITDDGTGIPDTTDSSNTMGINIMKYRANIIGAELKIEPGDTCGTKVTCTW